MPRKKEFKLEDTFCLPESEDLIKVLRGHRERALSFSYLAQKHKWGFKPLWEYTDRETLIAFTQWLKESPIFEQDKDGNIFLYDPGKRRIPRKELTPANVIRLLLGLSGELANFFLGEKYRLIYYHKFLRKRLSIVEELKNRKSELIKLGIVRKDAFDKVCAQIAKWMLKLRNHYLEEIPFHEKEELVGDLYPYFKNLTPLPDITIYRFIGLIMKHLGIEKADVRRISDTIRKRMQRKGIKKGFITKGFDIDRLKKTLSHLTHLPL